MERRIAHEQITARAISLCGVALRAARAAPVCSSCAAACAARCGFTARARKLLERITCAALLGGPEASRTGHVRGRYARRYTACCITEAATIAAAKSRS